MVRAGYDFTDNFLSALRNDEEDISTLFCSELVADAYQESGLLSKTCID